jgi:hemerythrin superfamily protein
MSKVIDLIKQDHRKVEGLFSEFKKTKSFTTAQQICAELTAHALLEEELLYPLLKNQVDAEETEHAQEEHDEAKQLIARIQAMRPDSPELPSMVQKLEKGITHHVKEEETEVLPKAEKQLAQELQKMEAHFIERKQQLVEAIVEEGPAGATTSLVDLTREELYQKAQQMDITGRSEMTKEQLLEAIQNTQTV